jgi:hypothetical protein
MRKKELFQDLGPARPIQNTVYDIGEIGREEDTKYYSAKGKQVHIELMNQTLELAERAERRRQQKNQNQIRNISYQRQVPESIDIMLNYQQTYAIKRTYATPAVDRVDLRQHFEEEFYNKTRKLEALASGTGEQKHLTDAEKKVANRKRIQELTRLQSEVYDQNKLGNPKKHVRNCSFTNRKHSVNIQRKPIQWEVNQLHKKARAFKVAQTMTPQRVRKVGSLEIDSQLADTNRCTNPFTSTSRNQ